MANGHGGARPGAGRKPGAAIKVDHEFRRRAPASGEETPLDYMPRIMRDKDVPAERRDDMTKAAAPYLNARLASVPHAGGDGKNIVVEIVRFAGRPATPK
jgi:hypothetical protein